MKVTIDSSEPLDDALRVLGALYDVTLVVSPSAAGSFGEALQEIPATPGTRRSRPSRRGRPKSAPSDA